jgi:serine phosphatase RsbU (regulator of sigma subunit)
LNLEEFDVKNQSPTTHLELVTIMGDVINFPALQDSIDKNSNYFGSDSIRIYNKINFSGTEPFFHYPKDLQLPHNLNNVTFNFYALEGNSPHRINYHYRLIGLDESWNEIDYPEVKFTNLDPGSYTFEAEAKIIGKPWGKKLSYSFEIRPPFWETWWFRSLMIASTIGIVVSIFRLRNKQLIARQVHLEKTVKERTLEIEEKKALIEEKQKEIVDSINYAKRIQYALLAHEDLLKENLPSYFIYFNPKDIVSGDFYWATKKDDRFYIAVCDSTGHGVPGAFMSLLSIGFLTEAINEKGIEKPNEIFDFVRDRLITNLSKEGQKDGFDGILLCMDYKTNKITYAAANNQPVIIQNNTFIELQKDRMPVGMGERKENFKLHELTFTPNNTIYLYTDGYADQFGGPNGKKFKYKNLNQLLLDITDLDPTEQKQKLSDHFNNWKGDLEQVDDVCVIGIRF